ncbi:MAG: muramoyltetrapeptide carboxypeptidase [Bacteroidia bacterium]|nr:MAG: muramoyltetrapeptide carboxypeptidase [Bacteroidia bacterium]
MTRRTRLVCPPRLRANEVIGLISPASTPSSAEKVEKAVSYLERCGYRVRLGKHVLDERGYLAGSDEDRASDLNEMLRDRSVRAIIALRGGYGTPRILDRVDYRALKKDPKILVGYSDLTALQLAILRQSNLITFSGPMAAVEMWNGMDPFTEEHFWKMITEPKPAGLLSNPADDPVRTFGTGTVRGRLMGGNLSLVVSLLGTRFCPRFDGAILVVEDVDEAPHRVDRMFVQLKHAGVLNIVRALVLGRFTDCVPSDPSKPHLTIDEVLSDVVDSVEVPVLANLQYGHIPKKLTIPLGAPAVLDVSEGTLEVVEAAVS